MSECIKVNYVGFNCHLMVMSNSVGVCPILACKVTLDTTKICNISDEVPE